MSLNESRGITRRGLTPKQQHEQLAAIYGLKPQDSMTPQFTPEELDRMRQIVAAADATQGMKGIREFDLNNPPKEPYTHKEYPRVMYHHAKKITQMANSDKDVAALLKKGFVKNPPVEAPPPEEADIDMTETGQA